MAAPWTQAYIQAKIDYYSDISETIANSQEYSYDQGPAGQFGVRKGKLSDVDKIVDKWVARMEKWYPDAFAEQPQITFTESAYKSG
jgi:hypothetical protein